MLSGILKRRHHEEVETPVAAPEVPKVAASPAPVRSGLRVKCYYAPSVEAGVQRALRELGPEAMLIRSRRAAEEYRGNGEYEVVFGINEDSERTPEPGAPAPEPRTDTVSKQLAELRAQLLGIRLVLGETRREAPAPAPQPVNESAYAILRRHGIDEPLAWDIARAVKRRLAAAEPGARPGAAEREALRSEMLCRIAIDSRPGSAEPAPSITVFVGPAGSGKTTMLIKFAADYWQKSQRPLRIISLDAQRIGGVDQLRCAAETLRCGFSVLKSGDVLRAVLREYRGDDPVLIDTPGYGPSNIKGAAPLAAIVSEYGSADVQLVVPASMQACSLARVIQRFEVFRPRKLAFTMLDEAGSFAPMFQEIVRAGKPLSFFGTGPALPEDFEPATAARIVDALVPATGGEADSGA